jgi:glycosyltransferase involved in cell wall biosynthesis
MRILFVVDGRSPIALNWVRYFVEQGHEVHLASTYACAPDLKLAGLEIIPAALSEAAGATGGGGASSGGRAWLRRLAPVGLRTALRQQLGPLTLPKAARRLAALCERLQPDLVHAMRIPFEGMLAALARPAAPLLISIWGNDFTLHARSTRRMGALTRLALGRADALHADCRRDIRLAGEWGFPSGRPFRVLPGSGGIQLETFYPAAEPPAEPLVVNPRGFRAYLRSDTFFKAIPLVLAQRPETRFACPNMAHEAQARAWVEELGIGAAVDLLPSQSREAMADLFRRTQIVVSPSTHDGTPNTLLEALACGCFPVVGELESLREWITPGVNGLLVDPGDPQALAGAIVQALAQPDLRRSAAAYNRQQIEERAEYQRCMQEAERFYLEIKNRA